MFQGSVREGCSGWSFSWSLELSALIRSICIPDVLNLRTSVVRLVEAIGLSGLWDIRRSGY